MLVVVGESGSASSLFFVTIRDDTAVATIHLTDPTFQGLGEGRKARHAT
jgi:hypothetical protein